MVTRIIACYHCESQNIVKNGKAPNGKQKYLCHDCGRQSREDPDSNAYGPQRREEILRAYQERSSLRGLTRTFEVSRYTVTRWLKKAARLPSLERTLLSAPSSQGALLELDELWSFVGRKADKRWVLDRPGTPHSSGARLRYRRPWRANLSQVVGEDSRKNLVKDDNK